MSLVGCDSRENYRVAEEMYGKDQTLALRLISGMCGLSGEPLRETGDDSVSLWRMPAQQVAAESLSSERQTPVIQEANANLQEEALEPRLLGRLASTWCNPQLLRCSFAIFSPECPVQMVEHMMGAWFRQRQVPATREYPGFAARGSAV